MRITRRQLTQIIREELLREAPRFATYADSPVDLGSGPQDAAPSTPSRRRIPNDKVKELQRLLGVEEDGVWGPITQAAWDKFVQANYGHPDINPDVMSPSVKEVQSDWATTGPKLGYEGDISGALTWVQQVQSTGESSTEIVPMTQSPMTAASAEASPVGALAPPPSSPAVAPAPVVPLFQQAEDAVTGRTYTGTTARYDIFPGEKYHISIYTDGLTMWKYDYLISASSTDNIEIVKSTFPNEDGALIRKERKPEWWKKTKETNIMSFDNPVDANAAFAAAAAVFNAPPAANESLLKRWNKLAGLLVD